MKWTKKSSCVSPLSSPLGRSLLMCKSEILQAWSMHRLECLKGMLKTPGLSLDGKARLQKAIALEQRALKLASGMPESSVAPTIH